MLHRLRRVRGIVAVHATSTISGGGAHELVLGLDHLRSISIEEWLAYPPKLTVELGSYVDGEAHGWAR